MLRRLARKLTPRPGWPRAPVRLPPGINEVAPGARAPVAETWVTHPLDLDIGGVADGFHLIARSVSLSAKHLRFEFAFTPEPSNGAEAWLNMSYGADTPAGQYYIGAGNEVQVHTASPEGPVRVVRLLPARLRLARAFLPRWWTRLRLLPQPDSPAHAGPEDQTGADREVSARPRPRHGNSTRPLPRTGQRLSMTVLASRRPAPVRSRYRLMAWTFLPAAVSSMTPAGMSPGGSAVSRAVSAACSRRCRIRPVT